MWSKQKVIDVLLNECRNDMVYTYIIGFDSNWGIVDIATDERSLKNLINKRNLYGLVLDYTSYNEPLVLKKAKGGFDPVTVGSHRQEFIHHSLNELAGRDGNILISKLHFSNKFVSFLQRSLAVFGVLTSILKVDLVEFNRNFAKFPPFKVLIIQHNGLKIAVSGVHLSLITSAGIVTILSDKQGKSTINGITKWLNKLLQIDKQEINKVVNVSKLR
jgi:hypothetical protein